MNIQINKKPIAIVILVVGFLILLKLQFPVYKITTSSMSPFLQKNDFVLINSLINEKQLRNNDVFVFERNNELFISRIVAGPGDKVEIVDGKLLINDTEQTQTKTKHAYKVILGNHPPIAEYDLLLLLKPINQYDEYVADLTEEQVEKIKQFEFVKSITKVIHPKGYQYNFSENPIFPNNKSFNWSRDNFGPIIIPKKGDKLDKKNKVINSNFYFILGDNRHQSLDSRYYGFISEHQIHGKLINVVYSPDE